MHCSGGGGDGAFSDTGPPAARREHDPVVATDCEGNVSHQDLAIGYDTLPPQLTVTSPRRERFS